MSVYVVRLLKDRDEPRELVGLYVAHTREQLEELVEQHCPTGACEYATIPRDDMYATEHAVPGPAGLYDGDSDTSEPAFFSGETLSEDWHELFFGDIRPNWRPLCELNIDSEEERHALIEKARVKLHSF